MQGLGDNRRSVLDRSTKLLHFSSSIANPIYLLWHCFPPALSLYLCCMFSPCGCCWGRLTPLLPTISGPATRNLNQGSYTRYSAASADLSPAQTRRFLVVCRRTKNWFCIIISSTNTLKRKSPLLGPAVTRHLTVYRLPVSAREGWRETDGSVAIALNSSACLALALDVTDCSLFER